MKSLDCSWHFKFYICDKLYSNVFPKKVFTLHNIHTLQAWCCRSHQVTIYCCYAYYYIVHMYILIFLRSLCIDLIYIFLIYILSYWSHSLYRAAISFSNPLVLRFCERELRKYNKHDFSNAQHGFHLIHCRFVNVTFFR